MAAGQELWETTEGLYNHPGLKMQASIFADKDGVTVTRYLFSSDRVGEDAVFVRMRVEYKDLDEVTISWGKGAYGASFYPGTTYGAREYTANTKIVRFQP